MAVLGELLVRIIGDNAQFDDSIDQSENKLEEFGKSAERVGKNLSIFVTAPILALGTQLVKAGSDAEETSAKFNTVFSNIGNDAQAAADILINSFDLSENKSRELLAATGDLLTGFGFTQDSALDLSSQVQQLAVDLASFTNFSGGAEGASIALTKALLGERESVKSLGISILETDVNAKVLELTQQGITFETERQAKAYATLLIAQEQSKNAIGDYARTQDGLANQFRALQGDIEDLAVDFGELLIPAAIDLVNIGKDAVSFFTDLDDGTKRIIITVAGLAAAIGPVTLVISKLVTLYGTLTAVTTGVTTALAGQTLAANASKVSIIAHTVATKAAAAAQTVLNAVMAANPFVLLGIAVAGVTAAIIAFNVANQETADDFRERNRDINTLQDEYEELASKTEKTVEEELRLKQVIRELNVLVPENARVFNDLGQQIGFNTEIINEYSRELEQLERKQLLNQQKALEDRRDQILRNIESDSRFAENIALVADQEKQLINVTNELVEVENRLLDIQRNLNSEWNESIDFVDSLNEAQLEMLQNGEITLELLQEQGRLTREITRDRKEEVDTLQKVADTINQEVIESIDILMRKQQVFGDEIDVIAGKERIYTQALEEAIEKGLSPQGFTIANLVAKLQKLNAEKGKETDIRIENIGTLKTEEELYEGHIALAAEGNKAIIDFLNSEKQGLEEVNQELLNQGEIRRGITDLTIGSISQINALQDQFTQAEIERINQSYLEEEEKEKKINELKRKAFIRNKALGIAETVISTAKAVADVLANFPGGPILKGIAAGVVGALGAAQTAAIAAQPLPAFAEGGVVLPTPGGTQVVMGEAGVREFAIPDRGDIMERIGDRISENMARPINNIFKPQNEINFPDSMVLNIEGKQFTAFLTQASKNGRFLIDPRRGIAAR